MFCKNQIAIVLFFMGQIGFAQTYSITGFWRSCRWENIKYTGDSESNRYMFF